MPLNRELMNELIYNGMLEPQQAAEKQSVLPTTNERLSKVAIEFDQDKAKQSTRRGRSGSAGCCRLAVATRRQATRDQT